MIVTVTEFTRLAKDNVGNDLPLGGAVVASQKRTAIGAFNNLASSTRLIRVASDTPIEIILGGRSLFLPAECVEHFSVGGGETLSVAAV